MKTEKAKMLAGELYDASDKTLVAERKRCKELLDQYNRSLNNDNGHTNILEKLFNKKGQNVEIIPPFYCDYGSNITIYDNVYFNYGCVILDVTTVTIEENVLLGPYVQIYTATHPMDWKSRQAVLEYGKPITIKANTWIGGGAIICPGVSIGMRSVIGAGSVVTKDIPDNVFAAGNPCRTIKSL